MKNNKGFSLVELIIVIAIMAVLVGVLAPTYLQYVEKSKKSNDVSTIDSIVNAVEIAAIDPEVVTDTTTELTIKVESTGMTVTPTGGTSSKWKDAVTDAVSDAKLKSFSCVEFKATRDANTGKVTFTYTSNTPQDFKDYAVQISKIS